MAKPNFFIVGAPKCGTTTLNAYLAEHPNVFMSPVKEPHYFAEHRAKRNATNLEEYLDLFKDGSPEKGHRVIGEASSTTLQSPGALERLQKFEPDAKILIMVRNPLELVQSMYEHVKFRGVEDVTSLESAWKLSDDRMQGRNLPNTLKKGDPVQLSYKEIGSLGKHVARAFELFPRENIHVIVFDDLKKDPREVYLRTLQFLGLPDDGRTEFEAKNVAREHGRSPLSRLIVALPHPITRAFRKFGMANRGIISGISGKLSRTTNKKEALSPAFRLEMQNYFRPDIELLSKLLGRDLTGWVDVKSASKS